VTAPAPPTRVGGGQEARHAREAERHTAIAAAARKLAARFPPLTIEQKQQLARLLDLGGDHDAA
jgi:hypothetical protein